MLQPMVVLMLLHHSVVWYGAAPNSQIRQLAANRYDMGGAGKNEPSDRDKPLLKQLDPGFKWFTYNSVSDNYAQSRPDLSEHQALTARAIAHGWNIENTYQHFSDQTQVTLQGTTLTLPAGSRVPVYYSDLSRRLTNFSTARARQLHKEVLVSLAFDTPYNNSTLYPDGLFLDNSTTVLYNYGTIVSGGHVTESGGLKIDSPAYRSWYWSSNLRPFLVALHDTLKTSGTWSRDRSRKSLSINVSNSWSDDFVSFGVADILSMEFEYNPVRDVGLGTIAEARRRDALAASAGIACVYSATMTNSVAGHQGTFSYAQTLLGNLTWYLMTRSPSTYFFQAGAFSPATAGWDTLTWRGCMDVADHQLGEATGEPYTLSQGVDPLGHAYAVKARNYSNGFVVLRNRGAFNEGIEPQTAVRVPLPRPVTPVAPSGALGANVGEVWLRNGQGALFLNGSATDVTYTPARSGPTRIFDVRGRQVGTVSPAWKAPSGVYFYRDGARRARRVIVK